ncbi:MAG: mobile mystery protein B [Chlamydiales bacterium]
MKNRFLFPEDATPLDDCSGLIPTWVYTLKELNRIEFENILEAKKRYFQKPIPHPEKWFSINELKKIHKAMFGSVWTWAGEFRKSVTSIGVKPGLIPFYLIEFRYEVLSWLKEQGNLSIVEMAARVHHRLVFIHPFENGNGRFSRFVSDRLLLSLGGTSTMWPTQLIQSSEMRKNYIQTLKEADKGDYSELIEYMQKHRAKS